MRLFIVRLFVITLFLALTVLPGSASPLILEGAPVSELAGWVSDVAKRSIVIPDSMAFKVWLRAPNPSASSALSLLRSTAYANGWEMVDKGGIISFSLRQTVTETPAPMQSIMTPPPELFTESFAFLNRPVVDLLPMVQSMAAEARLSSGPGNTLLVTAPAVVLDRLRGEIPDLDTLRARYRIEAIISEDLSNFSQQQGINLQASGSSASVATNTGATLAGSTVIAQLISLGDFSGLFSYLSTSTNFKILSTPYIISDDGERGSLHVGDNVPIQSGSVITNGQISTTFSRQDVGVILSIGVRKIGDKISLDILQEASSLSPSLIAGQIVTSQRRIVTRTTVSPREILDLGGLVTDSSRIIKTGIPVLKDIPWLGALFRGEKIETESRVLRVYLRVVQA